MKNKFKKFYIGLIFVTVCLMLTSQNGIWAIQVPLGGTGGGTSVGFVDMNELFKGYSKVMEAKDEFNKMRESKNKELNETEKKMGTLNSEIRTNEDKIKELRQNLKVLKSSIQVPVTDIVVADSTGSVYSVAEVVETPSQPAVASERILILKQIGETENLIASQQDTLDNMKEELSAVQKEYSDRKVQNEKELKEFEGNKTLKIMAELYRIIEDLAKEENISIVVEKTSVLYGQPVIDLTEKVKERLRGK